MMLHAAFVSDPENQAALASFGKLGSDIFKFAKTTVSNIAQGGVSTGIKSMQTGLSNPQQVVQIKNDMTSGNYRFNAHEGRIAGDKSYIDKLIQNVS